MERGRARKPDSKDSMRLGAGTGTGGQGDDINDQLLTGVQHVERAEF